MARVLCSYGCTCLLFPICSLSHDPYSGLARVFAQVYFLKMLIEQFPQERKIVAPVTHDGWREHYLRTS